MVNMKIQEIEGIGPAYGAKLAEAGVANTDQLLETGKTRKGRKTLATSTELSEKLILKWVNMADLFRLDGVGPEYAELLEAAGVDTVKELQYRNAENLAAAMAQVNEQKQLTRRVPTSTAISGWVAEAKELPPMVEY